MKKRKDPAAVELGRKGGKRGGVKKVPKGFSKMDPERRSQIACDAARARWGEPCACGTCAACKQRAYRAKRKGGKDKNDES